MRRVTLDDLLRAAAALEGVAEDAWHEHVLSWIETAHMRDCVRRRLGAARVPPAILGAVVDGRRQPETGRDAQRRLCAVLSALEDWRCAQDARGGRRPN